MNPLSWVKGNVMLVLVLTALMVGGGMAWTVQGWRMGKLQAEYDGFVATTKVLGETAKTAKLKQEAADRQAKKEADDENDRALSILSTTIVQLRNERASSSFVPSTASIASSPARACFDRAGLESAIRELDQRLQGGFDKGSHAVVNLDSAKLWAKGQK